MSRFRFRLATLRKIRVAHRDQMQAQLAEALQAVDVLEQQLAAIQSEHQALLNTRRAAIQGAAPDVNQLLDAQRYQALLRAQEATLAEQVQVLQAEVQRRRQALTEANREVRVLDKLESRQLAAHRQHQLRSEAKELDEIASTRFEGNDPWA